MQDHNTREQEAKRPRDQQDEGGALNSPGSMQADSGGGPQQIVHLVETVGKLGMFVILAMFLVIVALAFFTGRIDGLGEARAESLSTQVRQLNAEVQILKSEFNKTQAQLLVQDIIENPHQ
jgi:outer membrane murein-binding lipoprotein Lpp